MLNACMYFSQIFFFFQNLHSVFLYNYCKFQLNLRMMRVHVLKVKFSRFLNMRLEFSERRVTNLRYRDDSEILICEKARSFKIKELF